MSDLLEEAGTAWLPWHLLPEWVDWIQPLRRAWDGRLGWDAGGIGRRVRGIGSGRRVSGGSVGWLDGCTTEEREEAGCAVD